MATFPLSKLPDWCAGKAKVCTVIARQSANDAIVQASRTVPGVTRGGSVKPGFVPRDTGALAASLVSTLNGGTLMAEGEGAYTMTIGGMKAGDVASFGWTAPYARKVHYSGWFWVDATVNDWPAIVDAVVKRVAKQVDK